ncbi:MAG: FKBP-type peptidyl-prolyl cis-trans isomerase [Steroidobacteraceae bacterium]|jgi:FKBP-type peptidyl-prolyl cis-trans isomerase FkpA
MNQFVTRGLVPALSLVLAGISMAADSAPAASAQAAAPKSATTQSAAAHGADAKSGSANTDQDKALYALGVLLSRNLDSFQLSEAEFAHVKAGLVDGFHNKPAAASAEASLPQIQALQRSRVQALSAREKEAGQAYLDKAASAPGATKTVSGLLYIPVAPGTGPSPARTDRVTVNYEGRLIDGTVFDSSAQHGQAATLQVGNIIPCWTEALQLMKVGGKSRIVCPAGLAYGDRGAPPKIMPGASLEFDIELVAIVPPAPGPGTTPGAPGAPGAATAPAAPTPPTPTGH